jgi:WD40 repeat protein
MSFLRIRARLTFVGASVLFGLLSSAVCFAQQSSQYALRLKQTFQAHQLHGESLIQVVYSPSSGHFLTVASDGIAKVWSSPGQLKQQFSQSPPSMLFNGRLEADNSTLITASYNGVATLWSTTGSPPRTYGRHLSGVTDAAILPGGQGVITTSDDGSIRFSSSDGRLLTQISQPGVSRHLAVASHRQLVAVTQDIGSVAMLTTTGTYLQSFATGQGRLNAVIFSPDQRTLITAGFDGTIKFWQVEDSRRLPTLIRTIPTQPGSGWVEGLTINKAGLLASVSDDGILRLWSSEGELLSLLKVSNGQLASVAFSPDGKTLLAASQHGTVSSIEVVQP